MKKVIFAFLSIFLLLACQQNDKETNATTNKDTQQIEEQYHAASIIPTLQSNNEKPFKISEETVEKEDVWLKSLITETPQEGRALAIKMARKTIAAIQTDPAIRTKLRADYAQDTKQLISTAEVVAIEFQTVAQANNYWREN